MDNISAGLKTVDATYILTGIPLILGGGIYLYLYQKRYAHSSIPTVKKSFLLGHLAYVGEFMKKIRPGEHTDELFTLMLRSENNPPFILLDLHPVSNHLMIINDGPLADQITHASPNHPYGLPKSRTVKAFDGIFGETSILNADAEWKRLRKQYNPGFQPQHIYSMIPEIVREVRKASAVLEKKARASKDGVVKVLDVLLRMSFDIIGYAALEESFGAQEEEEEDGGDGKSRELLGKNVYQTFAAMKDAHTREGLWNTLSVFNRFRKMALRRSLNNQLQAIIEDRMKNNNKGAPRTIIGLTLNNDPPPPIHESIDQIKTFLFGGHDTTAATICWILYALQKHPHTLAAFSAELENVIPRSRPDLTNAERQEEICSAFLERPEEICGKLVYTDAVIKEALRLWAPASTLREARPDGTPHFLHHEGQSYQVNDIDIYILYPGLHRNPKAWGEDALEFRPERWLGEEYAERTSKLVKDGWYRPFEKMPRNCIGQFLSVTEMKVCLAVMGSRFTFERVGDKPVWQRAVVIAKPYDDMELRVRVKD